MKFCYRANQAQMAAGAVASDMAALAATLKYATSIVATLTIQLVYLFLQKYFVKGALVEAIKG
ncbi:hypothetical protein [Paenibacillus foliorum]|uniref:hypothetical protein n=1 Tax=Paenibacillus foliorum TaxID=2654974 RepID=UPI001FE8A2CD|nr:hypothetical protein [Paenibacillus foliorum]